MLRCSLVRCGLVWKGAPQSKAETLEMLLSFLQDDYVVGVSGGICRSVICKQVVFVVVVVLLRKVEKRRHRKTRAKGWRMT